MVTNGKIYYYQLSVKQKADYLAINKFKFSFFLPTALNFTGHKINVMVC